MILLLGASGYFGKAFASELRRRGYSFIPLTRRAFDYTRFDFLFDYLRTMKPAFLINAANHRDTENGLVAQSERENMMATNSLLPQMIARVCLMTKTPWGHVSSGSIYSGGKISDGGKARVEKDLTLPGLRRLFECQPNKFVGFTELDEPNFSFRHSPASYYSGTKALGEEAIAGIGPNYIWRLREAFNEHDEPCNLLRRLERQETVYDHVDSLSHLEDSVRACLDLWEVNAPFGIYNVTNPGCLTTGEIVEALQHVHPDFRCALSPAHKDPRGLQSRTPESHCILDSTKVLRAGVKLRPVRDALDDSIDRVRAALRPVKRFVAAPPCLSSLA
jgi:dTDP-4-dehydrorhamnose reductase